MSGRPTAQISSTTMSALNETGYEKVPVPGKVTGGEMEPTLKCYEYLSLRSQHKKEQAMKKALKTTDDDTSVDVTLTIMDIADIDCVEGSFKVKFKLHAIYKFDVKQKKETADEEEKPRSRTPSVGGGTAEAHETMEHEGHQPTEEELAKIAKDESDRITVDFAEYKKSQQNIFNKLFYKKRKPTDKPDAPLKVRPAIKTVIDGKSTWFRAYNLTADEVAIFLNFYDVPVLTVENIKSDDIPEWTEDNRISLYQEAMAEDSKKGSLSVMWTRDYDFTCKEVFELRTFPYDYQDLSIDLAMDDSIKFDMTINDIRFYRASLQNSEWNILEPNVAWFNPKTSQVHLRVERQSGYYLQNVVFMMALFTFLGLISFGMDISDLGSRTSNLFTLILTAVAFKFILASSLPVISYNTLLDYYVLACMILLALMLVAVIIPYQVAGYHLGDDDNNEVANHINTYMLYSFACGISLYTIGWMVYAKWCAYSAFKENMSRIIRYDPTVDPDFCYDFSISYVENRTDVSYTKQGSPTSRHAVEIVTEKKPEKKSSMFGADKMVSSMFTGVKSQKSSSDPSVKLIV